MPTTDCNFTDAARSAQLADGLVDGGTIDQARDPCEIEIGNDRAAQLALVPVTHEQLHLDLARLPEPHLANTQLTSYMKTR